MSKMIGYETATNETYWDKTPSFSGIMTEMGFLGNDDPHWFKWKGVSFLFCSLKDGTLHIANVETGNLYHLNVVEERYW